MFSLPFFVRCGRTTSSRRGTPPAVSPTGGNGDDVTQLIPLLDTVPPVRGPLGRPRRRPDSLHADRGYDHDKHRRLIRAKGVKHRIGRRGVEHGSGLGEHRYGVERTIPLLHWCRRPHLLTTDDDSPADSVER
jgi:transposase